MVVQEELARSRSKALLGKLRECYSKLRKQHIFNARGCIQMLLTHLLKSRWHGLSCAIRTRQGYAEL